MDARHRPPPPSRRVKAGDEVTDVEAAIAAGVRSIGHANKSGKADDLTSAGADVIVTTVDQIAFALG